MAISDIGRLLGADEGLHHQIVDTFATISQADHAWTEKIWTSIASTDGSVQVDFERLLAQDTLVSHPPKNLKNATSTIGSWDQRLDLLQRIFRFA